MTAIHEPTPSISMRKLPPLKAIHAFEAASRLGSFLKAAEELYITPSAVSHQIRSLEQTLGIQLFHRIHRSVVLTDVGRRYAEDIAEAFGQIEAATRNTVRTGKSDILTIHAVPSLASQWLMPRLSRFGELYPAIDVRLNASVEPVNLAGGLVDFDIRYRPMLQSAGTVTEAFPAETIVVLCSSEVASGARGMRKPSDLRHHTLIHSEVNFYSWRNWMRDHPGIELDLERGPRFDRSFMSISAAVDGRGVCLESTLLVERELDSHLLVAPLGVLGPQLQCHSLSYMKSRLRLPKMRLFRDWLFEELKISIGAAALEHRPRRSGSFEDLSF